MEGVDNVLEDQPLEEQDLEKNALTSVATLPVAPTEYRQPPKPATTNNVDTKQYFE